MAITATAGDLIKLCLKTAGVIAVGQTPLAEDANDALTQLNSMIWQWNQHRWFIYHLLDIGHVSTNVINYTVGPGANFNVVRPDRIESAYARLLPSGVALGAGPVDFPLYEIDTYEEYSAISLKQLRSFPAGFFYDSSFPLGTIYFYPIPSAQFELHIVVKDVLTNFTSLTDVITLPPEYYDALFWNLTGRLQLMYQLPVGPGVVALAKAALNNVSVANARVPNLGMPGGITRRGTRTGVSNVGVITEGIAGGPFVLGKDVLGP